MPELVAKPTLDEVASLLRSRTVDQYGNEVDTFTSATRPTDVQAQNIIDSAFDLVNLRVGRINSASTEIIAQAKAVVMLLAARLIETVYYPEQAAQNESAAQLYGDMYNEAIASLESAIEDDRSTTTSGFMASIPLKGLAAGQVDDLPINWQQLNLDEPIDPYEPGTTPPGWVEPPPGAEW